MKRTGKHRPATGQPESRKFPTGIWVATGLTSSTAVTLPLSVFFLHRHGLGPVLVVGLIPVLPYLLLVLAFVVMYALVSVLAVAVVMSRVARGRSDLPSDGIEQLYTWIVNVPIAFLTLTPVDFHPRRDNARPGAISGPPVPALPPASADPIPSSPPGAANLAATPTFYSALVDMAIEPGAGVDVAGCPEPVT